MNATATQLRRALGIAERIEELENELRETLSVASNGNGLSATGRKIAAHRAATATEDLGQGLAPAVVNVLRKAGKSLRVSEILAGLLESGYKFTSKKPRNVLSARIYKLRGVKKVGGGLFTTTAK